MASKNTPQSDAALLRLAEEIKVSHQKCLAALRTSLESFYSTGKLLIRAKKQVRAAGHNWLPWLEKFCGVSKAEAQRYMQLAKGYRQPPKNLSLREALKRLASGQKKTKKAGKSALPFKVASQAKVKTLTEDARELRLPSSSPETKFIQDKVKVI